MKQEGEVLFHIIRLAIYRFSWYNNHNSYQFM